MSTVVSLSHPTNAIPLFSYTNQTMTKIKHLNRDVTNHRPLPLQEGNTAGNDLAFVANVQFQLWIMFDDAMPGSDLENWSVISLLAHILHADISILCSKQVAIRGLSGKTASTQHHVTRSCLGLGWGPGSKRGGGVQGRFGPSQQR